MHKSMRNVESKHEYNRNEYDDTASKKARRKADFGDKKTMKDGFGNTLHDNPDAAKRKYGEKNASKHIANVDHVVPLRKVHDAAQQLGVSPEQAKRIANDSRNLRTISEHDNKSKGAKSNFEMAGQEIKDGNYRKAGQWGRDGVEGTVYVGGRLVGQAAENKINQARNELGL